MICMWSSWCQCHPIISCFLKIQNGLPFWCQLTQVVLEKRPLNRCSRYRLNTCLENLQKSPNLTAVGELTGSQEISREKILVTLNLELYLCLVELFNFHCIIFKGFCYLWNHYEHLCMSRPGSIWFWFHFEWDQRKQTLLKFLKFFLK